MINGFVSKWDEGLFYVIEWNGMTIYIRNVKDKN